MKVKGEVGIEIKEDIATEAELQKTAWFKDIDVSRIPYAQRPKGGVRFEFKGYGNLQDMALQIKEAAPYKFQHTGDVNRNAHYIGMYILREMHVNRGCNQIADAMEAVAAPMIEQAQKLSIFRGQFLKIYELWVQGIVSFEQLQDTANKMLDKLNGDKESREWLEKDIERIMASEGEFGKVKNKLYMRKYRAGLTVIDGGGE